MQDNIPDALIAAFERHYDCSWDTPTLRNERLAWRAAWAEATKPCLLQIQEPAAAEQAAWHAGLDEGLAQATGSVSNATSQAAPAVVNASETPNSSTIAIPRGWKLVPDDATPEWIENLEALPDWREAVGECIKKFLAAAPAAPQAAPAAVAVPDGWKLVPVVPTLGMGWAYLDKAREASPKDDWKFSHPGYEAALSAAPQPLALAATPAADAPTGWKLVPMEPTAAMLERAGATDRDGTPATYKTLYMAMVGASPAAAPVVLPEPVAWLVERSAFRVSPHGQDAESFEWIEQADEPGQEGSFAVYTEQQLRALLATATGLPAQAFQQRVQPWMMACFGPAISADVAERNHRFLEEALELVQACGCTASEAHQLVDYVFGRPVGDKQQEVGGVMVTLAALCLAQGLDMHAAGEVELARIWTKVEAIRAKQAAKPKHSPLPMHAPQAQADARDAEGDR